MNAIHDIARLHTRFKPVLDEIVRRSTVADCFVHRDAYRIHIATLWTQIVLKPQEAGIDEEELEVLHALLNGEIERLLGTGNDLTSSFAFLNSKAGQAAMQEARLTPTHKDLLLYFCSMILDPDGHRKWTERLRRQQTDPNRGW